jgi:hypothetical protein
MDLAERFSPDFCLPMAPALSMKGTETSASPFCGQHSGARNCVFNYLDAFFGKKARCVFKEASP